MSGWKTAALVARRELTERARERSFAIGTALSVAILIAVILVPKAFEGDSSPSRVGLVAETSELAPFLEGQTVDGEPVQVERFASAAAAERALRDGRVDVVVTGRRILVEDDLPDELASAVQAASAQARARAALAERGITGAAADAIVAPPPLSVLALSPDDEGGDEGLAFVAVILLYGQVFAYGFWVASGVVEEKASRIVEILLAAIRPRQLLAGKIVGIGLLGLLQLVAIAAIGLAAALAADVVDAPGRALATVGIAVAWFVLGYAFYACLFAVCGALISRVEELQNATTPLSLALVGSLVLSFVVINDPEGTLARVASVVPPVSAVVMPPRIAAGEVAVWEIGIAAALMVVVIVALVPVAARIYENAVLRTGRRVKLREVWRSAV